MRKVIVQEFVSLDGMAAGENNSVDFVPAATHGDESFGARQLSFMDSVDTILLGRKTYELFASYWPNVTSGDDKEFADRINAIPKIVASQSLDRAPWGEYADATIVKDQLLDEVAQMKRQPGRDIVVWGSLSVAQALEDGGLIDDVQLIVCPVVLGTGRRLFREGTGGYELSLRDTRSFDRGVVLLSYAPEKTASAV
jgi:dihydrofolate reductase